MDLGEGEVILCGQVVFALFEDVVADIEILVVWTNFRWWQCGVVPYDNGMVFEAELMVEV